MLNSISVKHIPLSSKLVVSMILVLGLTTSCLRNRNNLMFMMDAKLESISHDGLEREYILFVPDSYDGTKEVPLMFNFHGWGMTARKQMNRADMRDLANAENFILVYPQAARSNGFARWNVEGESGGEDDFGFVAAMIDQLSSNYNIDRGRVYSCGYSNGAFFSYALACFHSDRIAAIGSVAGSMRVKTHGDCRPSRPIPVINIHGTADNLVPYVDQGGDGIKSITDVLDYWIEFNNTSTSPETGRMNESGFAVERYSFTGGDNNTAVDHYKVIDGGHSWLNIDYNGSSTNELIWDFVSAYDINGRRE